MRKRVVVTGMGCISPVGNNVKDTWDALLAGKSGAGLITQFDASNHKTKFAAEVKNFDGVAFFGVKEARKLDRFAQLGLAAAHEALEQSGLKIDESNRDRIGIFIGSGIGGINIIIEQYELMKQRGPERVSPFLIPMMIPDSVAGNLAIRVGARGPNMSMATACATGTNALGEAAETIRRGAADVMIAGASEAAINSLAFAGMNTMTALSTRNDDYLHASRPFDKNRDGFMMGEGAGIMILESLEHAQARGANIICEFTGYGTSDDAHHISAPADNGAGAALSMKWALEDANFKPADIQYINAHGTSTQLNDKSETAAIKTVFGEQAYNIPVSSTKSMTGHLLGASGAVEAIVGALVIQQGVIPATINYETPDPACDLDYVPNQSRNAKVDAIMSNSFGFGGHNATLILSRYQ
ncbi:MAG TPA: beta-ketoacyl-[acyl-carrier-protein] synthase II [Anaerolineae bacterium]|nr:beta-ketoacyl-[acyl-carrier-protein] synthase II [Anaerolineae bacterium]HRJ74704.1 beta-ketoacyl-ACP synthase II [Anaerolineales bacterium]